MAERTNTSAFDPWDTVRLTFAITSSTVATSYVDSDCKLTIDPPRGASYVLTSTSTSSAGLVHLALGRYQADIVPTSTQYGRWAFEFRSTGVVTQSTSGAWAVRPRRVVP